MRNHHAAVHMQALLRCASRRARVSGRYSWRVRARLEVQDSQPAARRRTQWEREGDSKAAHSRGAHIRRFVTVLSKGAVHVQSKRGGARMHMCAVLACSARESHQIGPVVLAVALITIHSEGRRRMCKAHDLQREGAMGMKPYIHVAHALWSESATPYMQLPHTTLG